MGEIWSQCLPAACPPLFYAHPLNLAVRESPSAGVIAPGSLPRQWFPVKTPLPQPHKPIPTPLHSQQGKWRQVSMAGPHIPGDKLLKALGFPVLTGSVSKLSMLQRELTEELQNAIAYMTMNISHHLKRERTTFGLVKWREKSSCWSRSCLGAGNRANDLNPAPFNTSCPAEAAVTS